MISPTAAALQTLDLVEPVVTDFRAVDRFDAKLFEQP
jgi:hypothetical protein